jgi:Na+/H+-dicarboxylate symporter
MCELHQTTMPNKRLKLAFYVIAITFGVISGFSNLGWINDIAITVSEIFIKIFKCISMPLISLSMIVTIVNYNASNQMRWVAKKVALYTLATTVISATVACLLYLSVNPNNVSYYSSSEKIIQVNKVSYLSYLTKIIPSQFFEPFMEHNVWGVLIIAITFGIAIRNIEDDKQKQVISGFFQALHNIITFFTKYIVRLMPVALYGFIAVTIIEFKQGKDILQIAEYLTVVIGANLIQGLIILPIWLKFNKISPVLAFKAMFPALSLAFFSKSSAATLPVTIEAAESRFNIKPEIARFALPLCTTINMNGCAAFIFTTVIFVMQNQGINVTLPMMGLWIIIATITAVGNAGVPMGCFFLSASLLSSMGMPIALMGIILPFYSIIDMVETSLNVWSDVCVTKVVDEKHHKL